MAPTLKPDNPSLKPVGKLKGHFWVPSYQRGYRWGKEEVEALLNDLEEHIKRLIGEIYCLQPVVVKPRTKSASDAQPEEVQEGETYNELIDGQQRITTLYLLYSYLSTFDLPAPVFTLSYETRPGSAEFLRTVSGSGVVDKNIDYFYMSTAFATIKQWFGTKCQDENAQKATAKEWAQHLNESIQLIWFDAGQQDAIDLFTRLNAGRIALTNAELVKALLLANHGNTDPHQQTLHANQWDEIEQALHDDAFWRFLSNEDPQSYPTRIDLLLDLVAEKRRTRNDSFATFVWFQKQLATKTQGDLWADVWQRYTQLRDWFEDRPIYHRIGWLIATGEKLSAVMKGCLAHKNQSRTAFRKFLEDKIKNRLGIADIGDISYEGNTKDKCQSLLLLFNVLSADNVDNERYPFHRHKEEGWSLEHIHAQAAQPLNDEKAWRTWLEDSRKLIDSLQRKISDENVSKIVSALDKALADTAIGGRRFENLEKHVDALLDRLNHAADPHAIDNLALLSGDINTSLSNQSFPAKRGRLLEHDKAGRFIPLCTRRAFFKYYTESGDQQLQFWSEADRDAYRKAILDVVTPYLTGAK